ncbi:MAG: hypothetical protein V4723_09820 [Pseudomonadota bacterium]
MVEPIQPQDGVTEIETDLLVECLYRRFGVDFRGFERGALGRRLAALCQNEGVDSISALQGRILREPDLARRAMAFASESPSDFLTSSIPFTAMRCAALPVLRSASWPGIWIAECGDPALVIQLAAMLEEEGLLDKSQLFVTNANEDVLMQVSQLWLDESDLAAADDRHRKAGGTQALASYCEAHEGGMRLKPEHGRNIVWAQHDLASDASFMEFHLIACQRPLRDLGPALQLRALGVFSESLCNFGILQIEPPASIAPSELVRNFVCLLPEQGIYRRSP